MLKFTIKQLLLMTGIIVAFLVLRSWCINSESHLESIPFVIATVVGCYCGLTERTVHATGFWSGIAGMASVAAIVAEIMLETPQTSFMRPNRITASYAVSLELNIILVVVCTGICYAIGIFLSLFIKLAIRGVLLLHKMENGG